MVIDGLAISFNDVLIGSAVIVFILYFIMLYIAHGKWIINNSKKPVSRLLYYLLIISFTFYLADLVNSLIIGYRDLSFFIIVTFLFLEVSLLDRLWYFSNEAARQLLVIISIIVSFSEPLIMTFGNRFYPRYPWSRDSIYQTGSLAEYQASLSTSGLYYLVPVRVLNQDALAHLVVPSEWVRLTLLLTIDLALILALINLFKRIGYGIASYYVPVFIFWANPGNSFMMGRAVTEAYPFLFLYLAVLYAMNIGQRESLLLLTLVSIPMVFAHGSTSTIMLLLFTPLIIMYRILYVRRSTTSINWASLRQPLFILLGITLIYWGWTSIAVIIARIGEKFINSITEYFVEIGSEATGSTVGWSYTPRYYKPGFELFGYSWAFPIGVAAALALVFLFKRRFLGPDKGFAEVAGFMGVLIIGAAYLSYALSEAGQYWIPVGYFLAMMAIIPVTMRMIRVKIRSILFISLILTSLFVFTGFYSPTHAPLEHPDFETISFIFRYPRYIETRIVGSVIPDYIIAYYDYDLPIRSGIYKGIRNRLSTIMQYGDPWPLYIPPYTLVALKTNRLQYSPLRLSSVDVVYTSDYYVIIGLGRLD